MEANEFNTIDEYLAYREGQMSVQPPAIIPSWMDLIRLWLTNFWEKLKAGDIVSWIILIAVVFLVSRLLFR